MCEFRKNNVCVFSKDNCSLLQYEKCKFYKRQFPETKDLYNKRFKKALKKALLKRDIYNRHKRIIENSFPDYTISIYQNVNNIISKIEPLDIIKKEPRDLTEKDLQGNILKNIASNLYNYTNIRILSKNEEKNQIVVVENGVRYIRNMDIPIADFINKFKKTRKKADILDKYTITMSKI